MHLTVLQQRSGVDGTKFKDLMALLISRGLPFGAKDRLYSACLCSLMLYGGEAWPAKGEDVIRLGRNNVGMIRCKGNVRSEDGISAEELRTRLKLNSMREC